jgi:retron-type reverse transcriptase
MVAANKGASGVDGVSIESILETPGESEKLIATLQSELKSKTYQAQPVLRVYTTVYDANLRGYFDSIPHDKLLKAVEKRVSDRSVLHLIRMWLKSPVVERKPGGGKTRSGRPGKGTPQGGVISPL